LKSTGVVHQKSVIPNPYSPAVTAADKLYNHWQVTYPVWKQHLHPNNLLEGSS
jgi:hypothetical protein